MFNISDIAACSYATTSWTTSLPCFLATDSYLANTQTCFLTLFTSWSQAYLHYMLVRCSSIACFSVAPQTLTARLTLSGFQYIISCATPKRCWNVPCPICFRAFTVSSSSLTYKRQWNFVILSTSQDLFLDNCAYYRTGCFFISLACLTIHHSPKPQIL